MSYADPSNAAVISLRIYDEAGNWLGYSLNFEPTATDGVYTDMTPPGFYTQAVVARQHREYAGAAEISRMFLMKENETRQSAGISWGGEHVGSFTRRDTGNRKRR